MKTTKQNKKGINIERATARVYPYWGGCAAAVWLFGYGCFGFAWRGLGTLSLNGSLERFKNKVLWPESRWQRHGTRKAVAGEAFACDAIFSFACDAIFLFARDAVYLDVHFACAGSCKVHVSVHGVFWGRAPCMHIAVKSGSLTV